MVTNQEIATLLRDVHQLMQLAGENRFRAIAFDRAAQTIEGLGEPIQTYIDARRLTELNGVGESIAEDIYIYADEGRMPVLETYREKVPEGLVRWLDISGLGPKNIVKIHRELGISTLEELRQACRDGRVASLSGLGKKSAEKILSSIEWLDRYGERCLLSEALEVAGPMKQRLKELPEVKRLEVAGSLRRNRETIGDIDFLVAAEPADAGDIFDAFVEDQLVVEILGRGETKASVRTHEGRQVDLRVVEPDQFAAALLYFTGSKEHNVALRQRARERNLSLNEYGLFDIGSDGEADRDRPAKAATEEEIYRHLGLHFIPPELREGWGETEEFETVEELPLVSAAQIQGVIHAHTTWSDGNASVEEMARACLERGYSYLGISDHSQSAAYAGGLKEDEVRRQWEEIDRVREKLDSEGLDFRIFRGIESDILADGSLDYPDEMLEGFDFVIASIHSGLGMARDRMMDRFRQVIEHPSTTMIGHPTGRLLLQREGSDLDMETLVDMAAEKGVAIEVNAHPRRLDLDWRYGRRARAVGLLTSINPDAHSTDGIDVMGYGVRIARKGLFDRSRVINTWSADEVAAWFGHNRS